MRLALIPILATLGCATPYQSMGFRGGYEDTRLGPDLWLISVEVNSLTSRNTAVQYTYRRAAELCPHGFRVNDADRNSRDFYASLDGGRTMQNMPKSSAMLVVQCNAPPPRRCVGAPGGDC